MTLADDTRNYVRVPTAAVDIDVDTEVALDGVDHLVRVTDTDIVTGGVALTYEDHRGAPVTVIVPGDQPIDRFIHVSARNAAYLTAADLVAIEEQTRSAPLPSMAQEAMLRRAFGPLFARRARNAA